MASTITQLLENPEYLKISKTPPQNHTTVNRYISTSGFTPERQKELRKIFKTATKTNEIATKEALECISNVYSTNPNYTNYLAITFTDSKHPLATEPEFQTLVNHFKAKIKHTHDGIGGYIASISNLPLTRNIIENIHCEDLCILYNNPDDIKALSLLTTEYLDDKYCSASLSTIILWAFQKGKKIPDVQIIDKRNLASYTK